MTEAYFARLKDYAEQLRAGWSMTPPEQPLLAADWLKLALFESFAKAGVDPHDVCGENYVAHYSSVEAVYNMFELPFRYTIFASPLHDLNDMGELEEGYELWSKFHQGEDRDHSKYITVASFSGNVDNANMWMSYGRRGYGACLELRRYFLFGLKETFSGPVIYNRAQKLAFIGNMAKWSEAAKKMMSMDPPLDVPLINHLPSIAAAFVKDEQFEFESEYRLIGSPASKGLMLGGQLRAVSAISFPVTASSPPSFDLLSNYRHSPFEGKHPDPPDLCDESFARIRLGPGAQKAKLAFMLGSTKDTTIIGSERRLR